MDIINNKKVIVYNSQELKEALENDNNYNYIYLGSNITLDSGITINNNKEKVTICGTYLNNRYTLTGINSSEETDTINVSINNKEIYIKSINIDYTNIYGVINVPADTTYSGIIVTYNDIAFNGTQLSFNPYGTTKIIDSIITIEDKNEVSAQEVCESDSVIIGGTTIISSNAKNNPLFLFRNNTSSPRIVFLCKSDIKLSTTYREFMNGTIKLNFTILHDTNVLLVTYNGFSGNTIYGTNNVLIDERAALTFIENNHQRIPMWSIYGNFTMKESSKLELINSYENTPSDNYNMHFKGNNCKLTLDNPESVVIYTKNANVIYTNNTLSFDIKCRRINMWNNSTALSSAGNITNLPDYYWYKETGLVRFEGIISSSLTAITNHNLTKDELSKLSDIGNFSFQSRKQFSIGGITTNVHQISSTKNTISGHTTANCDVLIKYSDVETTVTSDSDGLFEYNLTNSIPDNTAVSITVNLPGSFIYETRSLTTPYNGELSLLDTTAMFTFFLVPISSNPLVFPKDRSLEIKVVDSRLTSSNWRLYAYTDGPLTSSLGYTLNDALVFKKLNNEIITLNETPQLVFSGTSTSGLAELTKITWSTDKGPLLNLDNNFLEANEEYFGVIHFTLTE